MNAREKGELGARLTRIAGQVAGIDRMLGDDRALSDVITQVSAARMPMLRLIGTQMLPWFGKRDRMAA